MAKKIVETLRSDPVLGVAALVAVLLLGATPFAIAMLPNPLEKAWPQLAGDPLKGLALAAALIAVAATPFAFVVLGRIDWFQARRGRVYQRPEFWSICCGMALIMGIPAIFAALVIQSQHYDRNRYEFDPNRTWSVLEQGRGYNSILDADNAVRQESRVAAASRAVERYV